MGDEIKRIVTCPECGDILTVVANVTVTYEIDRDGQWLRNEVDDDSAEPVEVTCGCTSEWMAEDIESDGHGLTRLGEHKAEDCGTVISI